MKLIILGAGGYGKTIADMAKQTKKYEGVYFLDDQSKEKLVLAKCDEFQKFNAQNTIFYPAFGQNNLRVKWINRLQKAGCKVETIIHKSAYISVAAKIGKGTVIMPNAIVNTNCCLGTGVIVNCGAIVDHECIVEDGVHVCLGAIVKAENRLEKFMKIEAGSVIENRKYPL